MINNNVVTGATAVIVGLGINGLGIVRALNDKNIALFKIDSNESRPGAQSRYGHFIKFLSLNGLEFINELQQFLKTFKFPPVLFLTEEDTIRAVSKYRAEIENLCCIVLPEHCLLDALMSKQGFDFLAEKHGLTKPKTLSIKSKLNLDAAEHFSFPCVLKPGAKSSIYGNKFKKAYKCNSLEEVAEICDEILPVYPNMVLQEWIKGSDQDLYFCLQYLNAEGKLMSSFSGKKLRCWPPSVGGTASCMPAREFHEELSEITYNFFLKTGFVGMGSMEYKRDPSTGAFYAVEPTVARTDFQHEVAVLNGVNIPLIAFKSLTGQKISKSNYQNDIAWLDTTTEKWSAQKTQIPDEQIYSNVKKMSALFRWSDPMPWLYSFIKRVRQKFSSLLPANA